MARPEYRRSVTVFFAAQVEQHAYGIPDGLTLFGDALLSSLSGSAAEMLTTQGQQQWGVTSLSLFSGIQHEAQVAAERLNLPSPLKVEVSGTLTGRGAPFHCLKEPPHVRVSITVTPAEQNAELTIMNAQGQLVVTIEAAAHNTIELPAGIYLLSASIEGQEIRQIFDASPPNSEIVVNADVDPMVKY
jgi:hypothetical protein